MDFFLETKGLTHFFEVIWLLNPKSNVCKLGNGVLLSLFAGFQDGCQNHTESYIVVDSLFNVPRNIWGFCVGLCFIMRLFVFFLFLLTP